MSKITYANKVAINENADIPNVNKVTDDDMNEIKTVVNNNDDELTTINTKVTNITGQILWSNSDPSGDFASQIITLSSSDYDVLGIYYYDYKVSKGMQYTQCLKGASFTLNSQVFVSGNYFIVSRVFSRTSDTSFTVDNAVGISASSPTTTTLHNDQVIPVYIVGYKTGLFN